MRRQSRDIKSKGGRQSSNGQISRRRSKRSTINDSSFIFSQIPRAAIISQSSGEIAFNKIVSSKSNLFQPATSECDYLQFQQNQPFKSQRLFDDKTSEENSSKRQKFWRVLQRNNDEDSRNSSYISSSQSIQKTSKKWNKQERSQLIRNPVMNLQVQLIESQPSDPTQQYNLPKKDMIIKRKSYFSISNKEVDFKVTPKRQFNREELIIDIENTMKNAQVAAQMIQNQTAQKKVYVAYVKRKKQKENLLHQKMKRRALQTDDTWVQNLKYFDWDQANLLHPIPKYSRKNHFPIRKTRISPLSFWKGERIIYRNNGKDGIWVSIEE